MSDTDEIEKFIKEHGITKCPSRPAAVLGESTPGWRRDRERRAECANSDKRRSSHQKQLRAVAGYDSKDMSDYGTKDSARRKEAKRNRARAKRRDQQLRDEAKTKRRKKSIVPDNSEAPSADDMSFARWHGL